MKFNMDKTQQSAYMTKNAVNLLLKHLHNDYTRKRIFFLQSNEYCTYFLLTIAHKQPRTSVCGIVYLQLPSKLQSDRNVN